jgi:type IV secretory pathway VirD2 relaxase
MPLEWIAVAHYNTEHPHVHIALRGVGGEGRQTRLSRDYIRGGIREVAVNLCTRQLGYRTEFDAHDTQRKEVHQYRYTSLDRAIQRSVNAVEALGPLPRLSSILSSSLVFQQQGVLLSLS